MNAHLSTSIDSIRSSFRGEILVHGHPQFQQSHLGFNLAALHEPDVVMRATSAADVATAVRFAADNGLPVRVQATGHSIGNPMRGGVLINSAGMQNVSIHSTRYTASVGAGVLWQQVIDAVAPHGRASLCGSSPTVGVVGYTLGGGMGPMARTFGFASDQVRRIQMVDARGQVVEIDPVREPDLFWALRGGKPEVGIVTELEFSLVEAPTYFGGAIFFPGDQASVVMHAFAEWAPTMPESVSTSIALLRLPDLPGVPEPLRGRLCVQLRYVHIGGPGLGADLLAPMRAIAPALIDLVDTTPSVAIASVHQDPTDPMPARDDSMVLREFPGQAVDALLAVAGPDEDVPLIVVEVRLMGGALSRPGDHDSAVGGRQGAFNVFVVGPYPPPMVDAVDASIGAVFDALLPWSTGNALINFQGYATAPEQVRRAWDPAVRERLDQLKQEHDPNGVFSFSYPAT